MSYYWEGKRRKKYDEEIPVCSIIVAVAYVVIDVVVYVGTVVVVDTDSSHTQKTCHFFAEKFFNIRLSLSELLRLSRPPPTSTTTTTTITSTTTPTTATDIKSTLLSQRRVEEGWDQHQQFSMTLKIRLSSSWEEEKERQERQKEKLSWFDFVLFFLILILYLRAEHGLWYPHIVQKLNHFNNNGILRNVVLDINKAWFNFSLLVYPIAALISRSFTKNLACFLWNYWHLE